MPSLLGSTIEEKAILDMLSGELWEVMKSITASCYTNQSREGIATQFLVKLEKTGEYVKKCGTYLLGDTLSFVDFYLYELLQLADFITDGHVYKEYPQLDDYQFKISQLPRLKEYLLSEDCLLAPFHMKFAEVNNWPPE